MYSLIGSVQQNYFSDSEPINISWISTMSQKPCSEISHWLFSMIFSATLPRIFMHEYMRGGRVTFFGGLWSITLAMWFAPYTFIFSYMIKAITLFHNDQGKSHYDIFVRYYATIWGAIQYKILYICCYKYIVSYSLFLRKSHHELPSF